MLTSSSLELLNYASGVQADFSLKILGTASTLRVMIGFSALSVDLVVLILGRGTNVIIMGAKRSLGYLALPLVLG